MVTDINTIDLSKTFTYADYLTWQIKERLELIKGRVFKMTPAPAMKHQKISANIFTGLTSFIREQDRCEVFFAPFDVRLPTKGKTHDEDITTVVQPDICIVCDPNKLDEKGCLGAPDIMVEILSPSTSKKDLNDKYQLYEESGVQEYWVVFTGVDMMEVYELHDGKYTTGVRYFKGDTLQTHILPGLIINIDDVFVMPKGF